MKITFSAPTRGLSGNAVSVSGYGLTGELQQTIGILASLIAVPPNAFSTITVLIANQSVGGQNVRIGFNPSLGAPISGVLLTPGDTVRYDNINFSLSAIASAAGALLDVVVLNQVIV